MNKDATTPSSAVEKKTRLKGGYVSSGEEKKEGCKIYACNEITLYWDNVEVIIPKGHVPPKVKHP